MGKEEICSEIQKEVYEYLRIIEGELKGCKLSPLLDLGTELGEVIAAGSAVGCDLDYLDKLVSLGRLAGTCEDE